MHAGVVVLRARRCPTKSRPHLTWRLKWWCLQSAANDEDHSETKREDTSQGMGGCLAAAWRPRPSAAAPEPCAHGACSTLTRDNTLKGSSSTLPVKGSRAAQVYSTLGIPVVHPTRPQNPRSARGKVSGCRDGVASPPLQGFGLTPPPLTACLLLAADHAGGRTSLQPSRVV